MKRVSLMVLLLATLFGCGGDGLLIVTGTVKYSDGTIPQGGFANIRFKPTEDSPSLSKKTSHGDIQKDGTFTLMTKRPGDGTYAGKYKVSIAVQKRYGDRISIIPPEYSAYGSPDTTPLEVTVDRSNRHFDFVFEPQEPVE